MYFRSVVSATSTRSPGKEARDWSPHRSCVFRLGATRTASTSACNWKAWNGKDSVFENETSLARVRLVQAVRRRFHHLCVRDQPCHGPRRCRAARQKAQARQDRILIPSRYGLVKHCDGDSKRLTSIDPVFSMPCHRPEAFRTLRQLLEAGTMPTRCSLAAVMAVARQLAGAASFLPF